MKRLFSVIHGLYDRQTMKIIYKTLNPMNVRSTIEETVVSARALVAPKHYDSQYNESKHHVICRLKNDHIANEVKSDHVIQHYGQSLFQKWGPFRAVEICQHMRQLCHLLIELNS